MSAYVYHYDTLTVFATYTTEAVALTALKNANEKGWKLQGRKYMPVTLDHLSVATREVFDLIDYDVEVRVPGSDPVRTVTMKKSVQGTFMDPTTETYLSA